MFSTTPDFNQSIEMMKNMWANASKGIDGGFPNMGFPGASNPFGIPSMDIDELEKKIKDLKSVEAWLTLNLNILQSTINGLEVQKSTLEALQGIAQTMKASMNPDEKKTTASPSDSGFMGSGGAVAKEIMDYMAQSMNSMVSSFTSPTTESSKASAKKAAPRKKAATNPSKPTVKTSKSRRSPSGA
ncbi:MAG: PhaM family polyhydroxyalkanoate granule multifunctional regulatory protein [Betaproteobacteria bacterium]